MSIQFVYLYIACKRPIFVLSSFYTFQKEIIHIYKDAPKKIAEHSFFQIVFVNKFTTSTNMEAKNLGYSLKNIPIPAKQHFLMFMMEKRDQRNSNNSRNFGFKSNFVISQNEKLTPFENGQDEIEIGM